MRKISHHVAKLPNNHAAVTAVFNNQMRQPQQVRITRTPLESLATVEPLFEGEAAEVYHLFEGLAEIAWEMGWRPKGLANLLGHVVTEFKLPKA